MKVTLEQLSSVKKVLHVEIPPEAVTRELNDAYAKLAETAKVKGFRPGRIPRSVLERLFKKEVHSDIASKLLQGSLPNALEESRLNILGPPRVEVSEIRSGEPYRYDAAVEVPPEIGDIDLTGLTLKRNLYAVNDQQVDLHLKMYQKNLARQTPIEALRPAQMGDWVLLDFEGAIDGKPLEKTQKGENFTLLLGKGSISPDFDTHVVGMNVGENRRFPIAFAGDHPNPELAGQTVTFTVALKEVREEVLPEIDDAFARQLGPYEDLDTLKKVIADNLQQGLDKRAEQEVNEQIFQALMDRAPFEVPEILVDAEMEGIRAEVEGAFANTGRSMEEAGYSPELLSQRYRSTAEKQARRHLLLEKVIRQEKLAVSDETLDQVMLRMAEASKKPIEEIRKQYRDNAAGLAFLRNTLLEKEAIALIMKLNRTVDVTPDAEEPSADKKG